VVSRGSVMTHPAIVAGRVGVSLFRCAGPKRDTEWVPYRSDLACRMQIVHRYRWPGALKARQRTDFWGKRCSDAAKRRTNRYAAAEPRVIVKGGSSMDHGQ
jgi:hypothetical protein